MPWLRSLIRLPLLADPTEPPQTLHLLRKRSRTQRMRGRSNLAAGRCRNPKRVGSWYCSIWREDLWLLTAAQNSTRQPERQKKYLPRRVEAECADGSHAHLTGHLEMRPAFTH